MPASSQSTGTMRAPHEPEGLQRRQVAGALDEYGLAGLYESGGKERERLLRTGGDHEVVGAGRQPAHLEA